MACAVGAVVAVHGFARITIVGISLQLPFGQLEIILWNNLVQRISASSKLLTGVAVAENMCFLLELHLPLNLGQNNANY